MVHFRAEAVRWFNSGQKPYDESFVGCSLEMMHFMRGKDGSELEPSVSSDGSFQHWGLQMVYLRAGPFRWFI